MIKLEKEIEAALVRTIRNRNGLCLKWVCPGWAGVPDRIVLLPGGRINFVELKRPRGGRLSARQVWWRKKLQALGFQHFIIWDHTDLEDYEIALEVAL